MGAMIAELQAENQTLRENLWTRAYRPYNPMNLSNVEDKLDDNNI